MRVLLTPLRLSALLGALVLFAACGSPRAGSKPATTPSPAASRPTEADLRVQLTELLNGHIALTVAATGAVLHGRTAEFEAAAAALDQNSQAIAQLIGSVYGDTAQSAFLQGWRDHIGYFINYTQADATHNDAEKQQALAELTTYETQIAQFFHAANGMPLDATVALMQEHVSMLTAVIDAQASGDQATVYTQLATSLAHMEALADPIAAFTARKFPQQFAASS